MRTHCHTCRTHRPLPFTAPLLLAALGMIACAGGEPAGPEIDSVDPHAVTLAAPAPDVVIAQNDPTTGCTPHATRGYGMRIAFSWSPPTSGATPVLYHLRVQRDGSQYALFDDIVAGSSFTMIGCHAFVIDRNLTGWFWQVTPVAPDGTFGPPSEARPFAFHPCRLTNGQACYAPPEG